jgi:hypothetical protein
MREVTFKKAICQLHGIKESEYLTFVLKRSLFRRARLVRPLMTFFYPDFLFNERRLVERVASAANLREIQEEVDFYQHKFVVNFIMKDAFRFRLSGMRLMRLANKAFQSASRDAKSSSSPAQKPLSS